MAEDKPTDVRREHVSLVVFRRYSFRHCVQCACRNACYRGGSPPAWRVNDCLLAPVREEVMPEVEFELADVGEVWYDDGQHI